MAREPLSDVQRKRLAKLFDVAGKKSRRRPNPTISTTSGSCCLNVRRANRATRTTLRPISTISRRSSATQKSRRPWRHSRSARPGRLKKALVQEQWDQAIRQGLQVLTANPWDTTTLVGMAVAAAKSGDVDCESSYLQVALLGNPKDPALNRLYAIVLAKRGLVDEAVVFWRRVASCCRTMKNPGETSPCWSSKRPVPAESLKKKKTPSPRNSNSER